MDRRPERARQSGSWHGGGLAGGRKTTRTERFEKEAKQKQKTKKRQTRESECNHDGRKASNMKSSFNAIDQQ